MTIEITMELTGKAKKNFYRQHSRLKLYFLDSGTINLLCFKWFNEHTNIPIDIQHWQHYGFDYAVTHPFLDKVFMSKNIAGKRTKDFDLNLRIALSVANEIYNRNN